MLKKLWNYPYGARFRGMLYAGWKKKVIVRKPVLITPACICFGKRVGIQKNCRIEGVFSYEGVSFRPRIVFGDGVSIQQNLHLTCAGCIEIGSQTAIAANVTITDIDHPYTDVELPVERQLIVVTPVKIGADSKIYNNAVILPGTEIGKHCVVGANSVVKGVFPDFCILAGVPARIVKRYNFSSEKWEKVV